MSKTIEIVDACLDAYRARDVDRFLSYFADDASVILFDGTAMMADKGPCTNNVVVVHRSSDGWSPVRV